MSKSSLARRTVIEIAFDGVDITESIQPYLLSVTYTDNEEDEADDLQITLQDRDRIWMEQWLMEAIEAAAAAKLVKDALEAAREQEPEAEKLKQTIGRIDDEEQKYQQKEELEGKRKKLEELDENMSAEEADLKEKEEALKEKIKALNHTVKELKGRPAELTEAKNESEKLKELLTDIDAISDDQIPEREKRKKALSKKQKAFIDARYKYEEASGRREEAERVLEDSRAGILARRLVEGEKCPVCGSVHHPEPAMVKEASISEDDFKKLQRRRVRTSREKEQCTYASREGKDIIGRI